MAECDCITVHERVVVPDPVPVVESVVVPDPVVAQEKVVVPVEVRMERLPEYSPDPLWPDLERCPAGHIWAICYGFEEWDYDLNFSQVYVSGTVDWGDGESEEILNHYGECSHHKFVRGTGRKDSEGREFCW